MADGFINAVNAKEGRLINGVKRTLAPTYQEIRQADPVPGDEEIYGERPEFSRPGHKFKVPNSIYFSQERHEQEVAKVWPATWLFACRVEAIQKVGGVFAYEFLDESILIVRTSKTEVKAFRNTCLHRGNQLRRAGSCGVVKKLFCPYHGAMWNLDGSNAHWPFEFDFSHTDDGDLDLSLPEFRVGIFQGFVFVALSDKAPEFEEFIGPLKKYMRTFSWAKKYPVRHVRKNLNSNWKILVQAFNEGIHIPVTHPQGRPFANVSGTQVEVLSDYVTRSIGAIAVPGDSTKRQMNEYQIIAALLGAIFPGKLEELGITPDSDIRARDVFAKVQRDHWENETGHKLPDDTPTTELVDNVVFHLFPNTWIVHGLGNTGVMRATPTHDPSKCHFDLMWFKSNFTDEPSPPAPEMIVLTDEEKLDTYWDPIEIGGTDGMAAEQDTENMEGQQRGLKANPNGYSLYADYLESAIIHDLKFMEKLING